jgi:copper resistance protein D
MTAALTLIRAVHFGSCLILQAGFAVLWLVAAPAWNQAGGTALAAALPYQRQLRRWLVFCLLAAFFSGFFWIWFAIAGMSGTSLSDSLQISLFQMVFTQTQPGRVWMIRAGFGLVCSVSLCFMTPKECGGKSAFLASLLCALCAVLLNSSLAWLGHAGASEGPEHAIQLTGDVIHLLAAGIWPAGLLPLALFLRRFLDAGDPALLSAACAATRRFSALSLGAVGLLAVSGFANGYFLVRTPYALVSTEYGKILLVKMALFAAAVAIGARNLRLKPPLAGAGGLLPDGDARRGALAEIARNVLWEIGLFSLILLATGLLGITPPASHS